MYDPVSKSYGDPSRRPECKVTICYAYATGDARQYVPQSTLILVRTLQSSTIEFIAPSEYMLRPPQPAVYIFCLDVSRAAVETGYLKTFCDTMAEELDKLPGDSRTQVCLSVGWKYICTFVDL